MIEILNLSKKYVKHRIIDSITCKFEPGTIYGLVGPNGSGITTLMRCICGFARSSGGEIIVDGEQVVKDVDFAPKTGIIIEVPGFLLQLSAIRNLKILANVSQEVSSRQIIEIMKLVGLDPYEKKPVSKYSLGMRQRLGIAQAIMENPNNLILDEPFNGLDNSGIKEVYELLKKFKYDGKTIVLVSHSMIDISSTCDVVFEIKNGKLLKI